VSLGSADMPTVGKVDRMVRQDDAAWFSFRGYRFLYEGLEEKTDDNRTADIAKVSLWTGDWKKMTNGAVQWRNLERIATGYPGRNDYHKGEQPTTEVSINTRLFADFSGFDIDSQTANFRVFVNPLINFVWAGFILLAFGVFICLIPQGLVDLLSPRPRTQLGRAADLAGVIILVGAIVFGTTTAARADTPTDTGPRGGAEHVDETGRRRMGHDDGAGYAQLYRPANSVEADLMKELVCMCGGCQRESLFGCKCAEAADGRRRVQELMADFKSRGMSDDEASKSVIKAFVREYGGEDVLSTPSSKMSWLLPSVAVIGGLGLLLAVGYRWVARGKQGLAAAGPVTAAEDDTYAERLDDELRDTD
jgi:cytochrome c-type biogenesis protein CcmF